MPSSILGFPTLTSKGATLMPHPDGGRGSRFATQHTFRQAYGRVQDRLQFQSTTGENIIARRQTRTRSAVPAIAFDGENHTHGSVCEGCWGFRESCQGSWIGQCVEGLDRFLA